jgi:hypothetical protein
LEKQTTGIQGPQAAVTTMEDYLMKKSDWLGKWNKRYCRVVDTSLVYFKDQMDKTPTGMIDLNGATAKVSRKNNFTFSITTKNKQKYYFAARSMTARNVWMDTLVDVGGQVRELDSISMTPSSFDCCLVVSLILK